MLMFLYLQPGMDGRNCYSDEHYLPTFFSVSASFVFLSRWSICISNSCLFWTIWNQMTCVFVFSDVWSSWHCKLVSDTCWLVWRKVASKIIHGSRYHCRALEKYYCKVLLSKYFGMFIDLSLSLPLGIMVSFLIIWSQIFCHITF